MRNHINEDLVGVLITWTFIKKEKWRNKRSTIIPTNISNNKREIELITRNKKEKRKKESLLRLPTSLAVAWAAALQTLLIQQKLQLKKVLVTNF